MNSTTKSRSDIPVTEFEYRSLAQVLELLGCSRSYLYKKIREKKITPYYMGVREDGTGEGKPYFDLIQIKELFQKAEK
ncbi:MAG: hypothetical protein ABJF04_25645 [Reichenbachiella sp.]|uniref:helix-turn-helix transcriptional regulator n=1 Tax=Reichenbachiella sp. TaxID=2184521 RepID=UPI0032634F07